MDAVHIYRPRRVIIMPHCRCVGKSFAPRVDGLHRQRLGNAHSVTGVFSLEEKRCDTADFERDAGNEIRLLS